MLLSDSPLKGKRILFLGSSVTCGSAAKGVSFADYIGARNGCGVIKEAVSGTTLADGPGSYFRRLKGVSREQRFDLFVCQLSTNDTRLNKAPGSVSRDGNYDTSTVAGAIEAITAYARETWNCPVVFYTSPRFADEKYAETVALLHRIAEKHHITVIDMWSDADFNDITAGQRALYMADQIHPTKEGYLQWWTPYMEKILCKLFAE